MLQPYYKMIIYLLKHPVIQITKTQ